MFEYGYYICASALIKSNGGRNSSRIVCIIFMGGDYWIYHFPGITCDCSVITVHVLSLNKISFTSN